MGTLPTISEYGGDQRSAEGAPAAPPPWAPPGGAYGPAGPSYPTAPQYARPGQYPAPPGQLPPPGQAPGGHWPPGYGPGGPPPKRGTNGFAIAALILGLLGGILLSVIFGIVALRQIKRTGEGGKGMAIAGLALSGLWVVVGIALAALVLSLDEAERDESGTITTSGDISVTELTVGDCLNGMKEQSTVLSVDGVPCTAPHDAEVYATVNLPDGDWPGVDDLSLQATQQCADNLAENYVEAYEDDSVEIFYFHPTSASWREGDREVICVATYDDGPRTGSLQD